MKIGVFAVMAALTVISAATNAHSDKDHKATPREVPMLVEATAFGRPGDPVKVSRTVTINMSDQMRFTPATVSVRKGETIRFAVRNEGKVLHEFVLGTDKHLKKHAELMRKFPTMAHDDVYMVQLSPADTREIVWTFDKAGEFRYACLIPGHYEAGMVGSVAVK